MTSEISKRALKGEKLADLRIIDCHCHLGPWFNFYFPRAGIAEMIYDADLIGVEKICVFPHAAISCDYRLGNMQMADAVRRYPERVLGMLTINANKPDEIDGEFDRYYGMGQVIGVKLHPSTHSYKVNGGVCRKMYEKLSQLGGIVLSHSWEGDPMCGVDMFEEIIRDYPGVAFVLGHSGGMPQGVRKSIKLVNQYENAYMDTSGFEFSNMWIEDIVSKTDKSKILFGSDYPFHDLRGGLSRILLSDLDDRTKLDILGENHRRLTEKFRKK